LETDAAPGRNTGALARAWLVHAVTALGPIFGFLALLAIFRRDWRTALAWLVAALVTDSFDGTLARLWRVKDVLPHYDGRMLDFVSDFLNFVFLPAVLLYQAGLVEGRRLGLVSVVLILLSSAYHFGNLKAVTADFHFRGFPAFWNMVVFYLLLLHLSPAWNFAIVVLFAVLHFVPIKVVYPTRVTRLRRLTLLLTVLWIADAAALVYQFPAPEPVLLWLSLLILAYMAGLGLFLTWQDAA
jgi:phosphatidylcholine synthase